MQSALKVCECYCATHPISANTRWTVFRDNDKPRYIKAFIAHIIVYGVQLGTIFFLRIRLMHQNVLKRRAQSLPANKANGEVTVRLWLYLHFSVHVDDFHREKTLPTNELSTTLRIGRTLIVRDSFDYMS